MHMKNLKVMTKILLIALIFMFLQAGMQAEAKIVRLLAQNEPKTSPYEKERTAEIEGYLAKAKHYFDMAEFTFAQIFYEKALRLDKDNPVIKARIEECKEYRNRQQKLLEKAPKGEEKREYLESKYDTAVDLYKDDKFTEARKEFEDIWLLAMKGDYKNTRKYLKRIEENLAEQKAEAAKEMKEEKKEEAPAKATPKAETKKEPEARQKSEEAAEKAEKAAEEAREAARKAQEEKKKREEEKARQAAVKQSQKLTDEAESLIKEKKFDEAMAKLKTAISLNEDNDKAEDLLEEARDEKEEAIGAEQKRKEEEMRKKEEEERRKQEEARKKKEEAERKLEEERKRKEAEEQRKRKEEEERRRKAEEIKSLQEEKEEKVRDLTEDARELFADGDYEDAIEKAEEALEIDPLYANAVEIKEKSQKAIEQKRMEEQQRLEAERRAKQQEEQIEQLMDEGEDFFDEEQFPQAQARFQQILQIDPGNKDAQKMIKKIEIAQREAMQARVDEMLSEGYNLVDKGQFDEAQTRFQTVLSMDPGNQDAEKALNDLAKARQEAQKRREEMERRRRIQESQRLFEQGLKAYERKELEAAVEKWNQALQAWPENEKAQTYLEETRDELEEFLKSKSEKEAMQQREEDAQEKMDTLISVSTTVPHTPLVNYLESLSLVSGINFYITSGVEATVDAKFVDTPLREVLDTLLPPIGLEWSRKKGTDIVTITPDLQTRIFNLTPEDTSKIEAVMETGDLQKILWGPDGVPKMKGVELTLDEREGILISVDSKQNIAKLQEFLKNLKEEAPPSLIFRTYRLREGEAEKVKSLLEAILKAESREPYAPERRILVDGRDLIVKDTPENIQRIEKILQDKGFIEKIRSDKLQVNSWILVPKEALKQNPEQLRQFGEWVVEVVKVMLYSKSTVSKAEAEGRRLWWDPATMQLTLTDYPDNIVAVSEFISSLPQLEQETKTAFIDLQYAKAEDIASDVNSFLGLEGTEGAGGGLDTGESVTRSLSVGNEFSWRDVAVRLMTVNENDVNDDYDDSLELKVRTPGESRDITMEEFDSEDVDDYEIVADDISPSSTPGEGRARIKVIYRPPFGEGTSIAATPTPEATPEVTEEGEKAVQAIEDINAIFVEYRDPAHLAKVREWVKRLDIRKMQVSIETKFVEVIESRAKEFSSQLAIADLTQGLDFSNSMLNMRFANNIDELQNALNSQYEPPAESPYYQHLMKGTTVFSLITGGDSPINWQLRLLEAEGVVNVVNGPHMVVQNRAESARFQITRVLGGIPTVDASGNYVGNQGVQSYDPVELNINEVFITETGDILLDFDATIEDLDALTGGSVVQQTAEGAEGDVQQGQVQYTLSRLTKEFETVARIRDGGTIVVGGWTNERSGDYSSGIPIIHNIPYIGKMLFGRNLRHIDRTTLLIFLTARIVE